MYFYGLFPSKQNVSDTAFLKILIGYRRFNVEATIAQTKESSMDSLI